MADVATNGAGLERVAGRRPFRLLGTAGDEIFGHLMFDVMSSFLRPGQPLTERTLAERFGVSRYPVREGIKRLVDRGFADQGFDGAVRVRRLNCQEVEELFWLRRQLEGLAAGLRVKSIHPSNIGALEKIDGEFLAAVERGDLLEMLSCHRRFCELLSITPGNRWLYAVLVDLRDTCEVACHAEWQDPATGPRLARLHERIIAALRRRDGRAFRALVLGVLDRAFDAYLGRLAPQPSGGGAPVAPARPPLPSPERAEAGRRKPRKRKWWEPRRSAVRRTTDAERRAG